MKESCQVLSALKELWTTDYQYITWAWKHETPGEQEPTHLASLIHRQLCEHISIFCMIPYGDD